MAASMAAMGGMPMPGGWTMSMMWMRMPDQTWPGAAASFLGMWAVMMAAMMLPSLIPMVWHYRQALESDPRFPDIHVSIALIYEKLELLRTARVHWRRYLALEPAGSWARVARQRLEETS